MNAFPNDFQHKLSGFGGDKRLSQAEHRTALIKTPIILVHGQAASATHPQWGWLTMKDSLKKHGYQDCEIWAMDYLGEENTQLHMPTPVIESIDCVRQFIDSVIDYLGVERVDIVCHSLGGMVTNAYLRGFQPDGPGTDGNGHLPGGAVASGTWNNANHRFNKVGTVVFLASCNYGLGSFSQGEFQTGGAFEASGHKFEGIMDDTPKGTNDTELMIAPEESWKVATTKDVGDYPSEVTYVAFTAESDFVDAQNRDTGHLVGAHCNRRFNLGFGVPAHEKIIKSEEVLGAFLPYLNNYPPSPPIEISIDKESGNYASPLTIGVAVKPKERTISWAAKRLTKEIQAGFLVESVLESIQGGLKDGESITLPTTGMWEIAFCAKGTASIKRTYGAGIKLPSLEISTPNDIKFKSSLEVEAITNEGKLYHSVDGEHFTEGNVIRIDTTCTVYFIALANGRASALVSRVYEKAVVTGVLATPAEHLLAKRITLEEYLCVYGPKYQWVHTYYMYSINGKWTDNPDEPVKDVAPPSIGIDIPEGAYDRALTLRITAKHEHDPAPTIFWTTDGSTPTATSPRRSNSTDLSLACNGTHTVKCFARDHAGNCSPILTRIYSIAASPPLPNVSSNVPSGEYAQAVHCTLTAWEGTTAYYACDGTEPTTLSPCFIGEKDFAFAAAGLNSIKLLTVSGARQARTEFHFWINESVHTNPDTAISPSAGGTFVRPVEITLVPNKPVKWTKYSVDGSEPSETEGVLYRTPFTIGKTGMLRWRSAGVDGHLEEIHSAVFTINAQAQMTFESHDAKGGSIKADAGGFGVVVSASRNLTIGCSADGKHNRAVLHFDTSSLPDDVTVTKAYLEVEHYSELGGPFGRGNIQIDVQTGYFGGAAHLQADDFNAPATARNVAEICTFSSGRKLSGTFNAQGRQAINKAGVTQIRLALPTTLSPGNLILIKPGARAKLFVLYDS